ncbi:MAG: endonuclease domain-containing protein [Gammaproteobacteria bacterium]|nr:endonuclease domain-containing protein [Gammaproteobacteria bacterium]
MINYKRILKSPSRTLRSSMTEVEILLWSRLRKRQILGVRFYRQKPLLNYIVDFYAHEAKLVVECDGSQHFEEEHENNDKERDSCLNEFGILVLRFNNLQILKEIDSVMQIIWDCVKERLRK